MGKYKPKTKFAFLSQDRNETKKCDKSFQKDMQDSETQHKSGNLQQHSVSGNKNSNNNIFYQS